MSLEDELREEIDEMADWWADVKRRRPVWFRIMRAAIREIEEGAREETEPWTESPKKEPTRDPDG